MLFLKISPATDERGAARLSLVIISGVMLGLSFPPFQTGVFAVFAFVPLFMLFESLERYGESLRYAYLWLLVVHVITLYWTGGFTQGKDMYLMIAGTALVILHPLFYFPAIAGFVLFRRQFGFKKALLLFPFFWVAMEFVLSKGELSFPWLTLGNTQTYDLSGIQIASIVGVYGISFWLLWLNVLVYLLYAKLVLKEWKTSVAVLFGCLLFILFVLPKLYGNGVLQKAQQSTSGETVKIGVVQPNIDPFEKWQQHASQQVDILKQLTEQICRQKIDLVIWPETALPFYILSPENTLVLQSIRRQIDSLRITLLTGAPDVKYYNEKGIVPQSSKTSIDGRRYDSYNSALLVRPNSGEIQSYAKIILVPFAERVPYAEELSFLNAMRWNFGLGGWGIGRDTTLFSFNTEKMREIKFSTMICYESVFPGFVADFVRKGAQFLIVITNDSWWGNTSGAYQHEQYAIMRAVENRRWVVRCANGGISCFIDPFGHIFQPTNMYTQTTLVGDIEPHSEPTFYSEHGDWLAESCLIMTMLLLAAAAGRATYVRIRRRER